MDTAAFIILKYLLLLIGLPFLVLLVCWTDYLFYKISGKSFLLWCEKKIFGHDSMDGY